MKKGNRPDDTGVLYMVATPIGNLGDITVRALETLRRVDRIFCEDTRRTRPLLVHYGIATDAPLISLRAENEQRQSRRVLGLLEQGLSVAYVSDAGTPGISDPGGRLAQHVRQAGLTVSPIPGASAVTTLLSVCRYDGGGILIEGFLPRRPGRRARRLRQLLELGPAVVLFESPRRLFTLIDELDALDPQRIVVLGRELTKVHEELYEGIPAQLREHLLHDWNTGEIKGECTLLIRNGL